MCDGSVIFHLLLLTIFFISSVQALSRMDEKQERSHEKTGRKLSRKKRYLIFPTGSSIQLGNISMYFLLLLQMNLMVFFLCFVSVYDQTITIPGIFIRSLRLSWLILFYLISHSIFHFQTIRSMWLQVYVLFCCFSCLAELTYAHMLTRKKQLRNEVSAPFPGAATRFHRNLKCRTWII